MGEGKTCVFVLWSSRDNKYTTTQAPTLNLYFFVGRIGFRPSFCYNGFLKTSFKNNSAA